MTKDIRMGLQNLFYHNVTLHCNFFPAFVWYYAVGQSILKSTSQIPKWNSLQLTIRPDLHVLWHGLLRDRRYLRKKNIIHSLQYFLYWRKWGLLRYRKQINYLQNIFFVVIRHTSSVERFSEKFWPRKTFTNTSF